MQPVLIVLFQIYVAIQKVMIASFYFYNLLRRAFVWLLLVAMPS